MKPVVAILACLVLTVGCSDHTGDTPMRTSASNVQEELRRRRPDQQAVVEGNTAFALDLYAKLSRQPGNLFVSASSAPGTSPVFRADHPFCFLIRHKATGSILFLGRLARP